MCENKNGQLEIAKKIIEQGNCNGISCLTGLSELSPGLECPFHALKEEGCFKIAVQLAEDYVEENSNKDNQFESTWQPIETAPKDGTKIIAFIPRFDVKIVFYSIHGYWADSNYCQYSPINWMPIPKLPEVSK